MAENNQDEYKEFSAEYHHIKSDIRKVIITNVLILAALVGAYYANLKTGFLNGLIGKIF